MIYHFILNPKSGRSKKGKQFLSRIKSTCEDRGLNYDIHFTSGQGDATTYVRHSVEEKCDEKHRFIILGGDGSINELVNACPQNPNVELGVIPCGSGNDFVRNFSNTKVFQDIEAQLDGETVTFNLIKCNEFYSANMINVGFDCEVVKEVEHLKKYKIIPPGISYIVGVAIVFCRKFGTNMKLTYEDGTVVDKEFTLTAVANGKFCGGGFKSAPLALLQDGKFDICAINKVTRRVFIGLIGKYKKGTYLSDEKACNIIGYKQATSFKMEFESPMAICLDGEIKEARSIDLSIVKNGFNFVIPKGSHLLYT